VNSVLGGGDEGEENAEGILSLFFFSLPFLLLVGLGVGGFGGGWWSEACSVVSLMTRWT